MKPAKPTPVVYAVRVTWSGGMNRSTARWLADQLRKVEPCDKIRYAAVPSPSKAKRVGRRK